MRKHSEDSSNEFMGSGHDCLSKRQAVLSSFKEIGLKEGIASDNANGHKIDNSSEVSVASFRDSTCALKLTRLIDCRVKSCIGDKGLMGGEFSDITYFSKKGSSSCIADTINRGNNLQFLNCDRFAEFRKHRRELLELFHQMKESRYLLWKDKFLSKATGGDGAGCSLDDLLSTHRDLSTPACLFKGFFDKLRLCSPDKTCRGKIFEEEEHSCSKDIAEGLQFREGSLKDSLNLVFSRGNKGRERFSFPCEISEVLSVLGDRELLNLVFMNEEESGDGEGVLFIGLGFSERKLSKIRDKKGVNNNDMSSFKGEEGKEINVVTTCGFHACKDSREVFRVSSNRVHELQEARIIHWAGKGKADITLRVKTCGRERVLGDIDTHKEFTHTNTSLRSFLDKAGDASRPILHGDEGSLTQSTYKGYGRQGTDSFEGSITQVKWSSPAFPTLTGKTSLYKANYNINS